MTTTLKKPYGVYFLATLFILAPLGNILISFSGAGIENWYQPQIFYSLMKTITAIDWAWLSLLIITGVFLFKPHKLSWSLAIVTLLIVLCITAFRVFQADTNSIEPHFLKVFSLLSVIITLGVLVIAFYFRFPYLDRRTEWLSDKTSDDRRGDKDRESKGRRKS